MTSPAAAHEVVFLAFDGVKMLDVVGPAEVFAEANRLGAAYRLRYASPSGSQAATSITAWLPVDVAAAQVGRADTVLVPGGDRLPSAPIEESLRQAAATLAGRGSRVASVCTGAFLLAAAGILDGRRATTHWQHARLLGRVYPRVRVVPDALFVVDGNVHTSAGVSSGIDLALALVESDHGASLARQVARALVVYMQRPGGQSQFSAALDWPAPTTPGLRDVVAAVAGDPAGDHDVASLAARVGVGPRHLARLFRAELGTTPARYVELVRLDAAKALLDAGHSVTEAARLAGFGSDETLRRVFAARLGVSPTQYRSRFRTTSPAASASASAEGDG